MFLSGSFLTFLRTGSLSRSKFETCDPPPKHKHPKYVSKFSINPHPLGKLKSFKFILQIYCMQTTHTNAIKLPLVPQFRDLVFCRLMLMPGVPERTSRKRLENPSTRAIIIEYFHFNHIKQGVKECSVLTKPEFITLTELPKVKEVGHHSTGNELVT